MTLTLETTDERTEAIIRTLDRYTSDRREQVYSLRAALQWVEIAAFTDKLADPKTRCTCTALLSLPDTLPPVQQTVQTR